VSPTAAAWKSLPEGLFRAQSAVDQEPLPGPRDESHPGTPEQRPLVFRRTLAFRRLFMFRRAWATAAFPGPQRASESASAPAQAEAAQLSLAPSQSAQPPVPGQKAHLSSPESPWTERVKILRAERTRWHGSLISAFPTAGFPGRKSGSS